VEGDDLAEGIDVGVAQLWVYVMALGAEATGDIAGVEQSVATQQKAVVQLV
jgi:hypothetical protein